MFAGAAPVCGGGSDGVTERRGKRWGGSLRSGRQPLTQLGFHIDSLKQSVAELLRDRTANLVICQQLRR